MYSNVIGQSVNMYLTVQYSPSCSHVTHILNRDEQLKTKQMAIIECKEAPLTIPMALHCHLQAGF